MILEYPISPALLHAVLLNEAEDIHRIRFHNVWVKDLGLLFGTQTRYVFSLDQFVLFYDSILMIADCAFFDIMHHIINPDI